MATNPDKLEAEANAELEAMTDAPEETPELTELPETPEEPAPEPEPEPPEEQDTAAHWEERYKNLQAHSTRVSQEASDLRRQLEDAQQRQPQEEALPIPDELAAAAADFEELKPMVDEIKNQRQFIRELKQQQQDKAQEEYYRRISSEHPDHHQIYQSPEFHGWVSRLGPLDNRAVSTAFSEHGTAEEVAEVFSRYKQSAGLDKHDQAAKEAMPALRSRSHPKTQPKPRYTMAQIAKMSPAEYAKHESAIDEAITRGEVG